MGDFLLRAAPSACSSYPNFSDYKHCIDKQNAFSKQMGDTMNKSFSQTVPK